jgi:hypothetical protein
MYALVDVNKRKIASAPTQGLKPKGFCLPVIDNNSYIDEPSLFKAEVKRSYVFHVEQWLDESEIKADWKFSDNDFIELVLGEQAIKPLDQCKEEVYKVLADKRWTMESAGVEIDGVLIPTDRETSIIIAALPDAAISSFKVSNGVWITNKKAEEVAAVKLAHRTFIQNAFDWEEAETALVVPMDYEQLKTYLEDL